MVRIAKKQPDTDVALEPENPSATEAAVTPAPATPKRRGRPPRIKTLTAATDTNQLPLPMGTPDEANNSETVAEPVKKPRGRRASKVATSAKPEKAQSSVVTPEISEPEKEKTESIAAQVVAVEPDMPVEPVVTDDFAIPTTSAAVMQTAQIAQEPAEIESQPEPEISSADVQVQVQEKEPEPSLPEIKPVQVQTQEPVIEPVIEQVQEQEQPKSGESEELPESSVASPIMSAEAGGMIIDSSQSNSGMAAADSGSNPDFISQGMNENSGYSTGPRYPTTSAAHPKPKYTYPWLAAQTLADLRKIAKEFYIAGLTNLRKDDMIFSILRAQAESMNYRFGGGTLEILPEGFGFLRPRGMLPTDNDVYLSVSQIRRFGLRNGDVIWGFIRPPREQEHYEALLRVEMVNYSDPESSRCRPLFSQLTSIYPNLRINLESSPTEWSTRLIDMFAPIGLGQRALIVAPPKAGKTTILKHIAKAIATNAPDITIMALLIDERPEEVTDISRSIDGEVIASTFDRPADEHIRVANLALEKAKRLVEAKRDVVILLDSITRLARASNLTVPPSGRTLSGGLDPSGLYFPKRFFGAARNFEEGGSLTIIGTALTDTGSRMDDVIYEEFKGTGNMELHLSRKLAEQRIFPAIDVTKSGTRKEELLLPEEELSRLWILRKRLVGIDEAGALNLILDKLRQTKDNHEFLMSIKLS